MLEFRSYQGANAGIALMRDGNGSRAVETLMRYRSAAMAEFTRALRTLKALQAEQAVATDSELETHPKRPTGRLADRPRPNEPDSAAGRPLPYALPEPSTPGRTLPDPAAPWLPNEPDGERTPIKPEPGPAPRASSAPAPRNLMPNEPAHVEQPSSRIRWRANGTTARQR